MQLRWYCSVSGVSGLPLGPNAFREVSGGLFERNYQGVVGIDAASVHETSISGNVKHSLMTNAVIDIESKSLIYLYWDCFDERGDYYYLLPLLGIRHTPLEQLGQASEFYEPSEIRGLLLEREVNIRG